MLAELVQPSIDYVRHKRFRSGNFPSSLSNESDRLVHWCHGAPGVIHMLIMAYKTRPFPLFYLLKPSIRFMSTVLYLLLCLVS
ncbi:LanC-like protein 2 [Xenoophorus captivus]|uniref:LanC-like protein 2 n=1 Tax=Xenoophorus captivus TaxID=1517983 RepID=A0ABV0QIV1_9TELE